MVTPTPAGERLIDALNLAYWAGTPPSLRVPLALAAALIARGEHAVLVFDASAPYRLPDEDAERLARLRAQPKRAVQVPSGQPADRYLLKRAKAGGGVIITRDRFREHRRGMRAIIHNPARRLEGWVADDRIHVPGLALIAALPVSHEDVEAAVGRIIG